MVIRSSTSVESVVTPAPFSFLKEAGGAVNPELLAEVAAGRVAAGDAVSTAAYREGEDYGGADYLVVAAATGTDDGGSFIDVGTVQLQAVFGDSCSVRQFGAVDGEEAAPQIQAFLDYTHLNRVNEAVLEGEYTVSAGVVMGVIGAPPQTYNYTGNLNLLATATIDVMFDVVGQGSVTTASGPLRHDGQIKVRGNTGSVQWSARPCRVGIRIADAHQASFGRLSAHGFWQDGIQIESFTYQAQSANSNNLTIGDLVATDCGTGHQTTPGFTDLEASWSNPVNSGAAGSITQFTTLDVTAVLPVIDRPNAPRMVEINNELYLVVAETATTIDIYPWLDPAVGATGSLVYNFGAGVSLQGSDANVVGIDNIEVFRCGAAMVQGALYGPSVGRLTAESNGSALTIGRDRNNASLTCIINGLYVENNRYDIVKVTSYEQLGMFIQSYILDPAKCVYINTRLADGTIATSSGLAGFRGCEINFGDGTKQWHKAPLGGAQDPITFDLTDGNKDYIFRRDSWTVNFKVPDLDMNRMFGFDAKTLTILGTGAANEPTGTITFNAPAGYTINGGASAVFSGFGGPVEFVLFLDVGNTNIVVARSEKSGGAASGSFTGDGVTTSFPIAHGLNIGTGAPRIELRNTTTNEVHGPGGPAYTWLDADTVAATFTVAPALGVVIEWRAV